MKSIIAFIAILPVFGWAHIRMINPKPRLDVDNLKQSPTRPSPCGDQPRMANPYRYQSGQDVTFQFQETINHPGRFLIQFSPANDVGFDLPENELGRMEDTMVGGTRTMTVKMPNLECDTCTVRVVQVMDEQPGELYVHCIDVILTAAQPPAPTPPPPPGGNAGQDTDGSDLTNVQKPGFGCGRMDSNDGDSSGAVKSAIVLWLAIFGLFNFLRTPVRFRV